MSQEKAAALDSSTFQLLRSITNLVFIEHVEDKGGELGGISEREELLVYLLKAHSVQLPTGTVFNEPFVPTETSREREYFRGEDSDTLKPSPHVLSEC